MNIRLQQLITAEGLNNKRFADKMGIQSSNVSHIINGRNKPSYDFIARMLQVFPYISPYWLILGEGNMYKGGAERDLGSYNNVDLSASKPTIVADDNDIYPYQPVDSPLQNENALKVEHVKKQDDVPVPGALSINSDIDRIVFFYKDGTFSVYNSR